MRVILTENKNGKRETQVYLLEDGERLPKSVRIGGDKCLVDIEVCSHKGTYEQRIIKAAFKLGARHRQRMLP